MASAIRTALALLAAIWFAYNAAFVQQDLSITDPTRALFIGLALIAAALVDWGLFALPRSEP